MHFQVFLKLKIVNITKFRKYLNSVVIFAIEMLLPFKTIFVGYLINSGIKTAKKTLKNSFKASNC